jgi:hypothetical protein
MPYQDRLGAYWGLLSVSDVVDLRRTDYDLQEAAERIIATEHPQAVDFVDMLRSPPSGEEASLHFEKLAVELKDNS